jgi:hypothetical protein
MTAFGKTNDDHTWLDTNNVINTTFSNEIQWNDGSGWYNNSFRTAGSTQGATINTSVFDDFDAEVGKTVEIDFASEKIA